MTGRIASKLTTNSQCTHWVSDPSTPVTPEPNAEDAPGDGFKPEPNEDDRDGASSTPEEVFETVAGYVSRRPSSCCEALYASFQPKSLLVRLVRHTHRVTH